jgi:dTDP-glucose 4,6-dehydratase
LTSKLPVNIGNPAEITIKEFGEEIAKLTGVEFKPTSRPTRRCPKTTP